MKKTNAGNDNTDIREEYDFSKGVRGKYADKFSENTVMVVLDTDVAKVFPDSESVNKVLRALAEIIREQSEKKSA